MIFGIHDPCLALGSKVRTFISDSDSLMTLITCYEAYISRSGDFHANDDNNDEDDRWKNQLLYPLRIHMG